MTNREYKLTDEMLVDLMEAHANGAEFSAALTNVRIPELLVPEAQDYWKMFGGMASHRNVAPSSHLFEEIWSEVNPPVFAGPILGAMTPSPLSFIASPYMKQLFAVAGAFGALVLVISSVQWNSFGGAPVSTDATLNPSAIPEGSVTKMDSRSLTFATPAPTPKPLIPTAPAASPAPSARMMAKAAPQNDSNGGGAAPMMMMAAAPSPDAKQLVAVLSETGTREATADTYIDDDYDKQLAAYDAAMTADNDTSHAK